MHYFQCLLRFAPHPVKEATIKVNSHSFDVERKNIVRLTLHLMSAIKGDVESVSDISSRRWLNNISVQDAGRGVGVGKCIFRL